MKLENLFKLQKKYEDLENNERILEKYKDISKLKELKMNFDKIQKEYMNSKRELEEERKEYLNANRKAEELKINIDKSEYSLYNDVGSDIKLIEMLQDKINKEKIQLSGMEDNIIKFLEKEDKMEKDILDLEDKASKVKEEFNSTKQEQKYEFEKTVEEIHNIKGNIKELEKFIDEELLKKFYDTKKYNKTVICELKDGVCDGCKIRVSYETKSKLNENDIVHCDNCGRILFKNNLKENENKK